MKEKFAIALNTGKRKAMGIVLAGALVLSLSTVTAFAASDMERFDVAFDENGIRYSVDGGLTWSNEAPDGVGVVECTPFSGDGKVEGLSIEILPVEALPLDGNLKIVTFDESLSGEAFGTMDSANFSISGIMDLKDAAYDSLVKLENGKPVFSTDGGKTWSETVPEGVTFEFHTVDAE